MGTGWRRFVVNLVASIGIVGVIGLIAFGLPAVDRALPPDRPVPTGAPYQVGGGVSVIPPPDASVDVTRTRPGPDRGTVLFVVNTVRYAIVVTPFRGTLDEAVERLRRRIVENRGYQVTGGERQVATGQGVPGLQGAYTAPGRAGRYAVFLAAGTAVEVTVSGSEPELAGAINAVAASASTIRYQSLT